MSEADMSFCNMLAVLILPYWNVNEHRTLYSASVISFNLTLLECKLWSMSAMQRELEVLILPYWNVNSCLSLYISFKLMF